MVYRTRTLLIPHPVEGVFAFITNLDQSFLIARRAIIQKNDAEPIGVGTTFRVILPKLPRKPVEISLEITVYDLNRELEWKSNSIALPSYRTVLQVTSYYHLESVTEGTKMMVAIQIERNRIQTENHESFKLLSKLTLPWSQPPESLHDSALVLIIEGMLDRLQNQLDAKVSAPTII